MVLRGVLPAGDRVNEVHLARDLSVSRTPLREALTRLSGERLLDVRPRLGFFAPVLTSAEVRDLYPLRAKLDPWALELSGIPSRSVIDALDELNRQIRAAAGEPEQVIELDDAWHLQLLAECPNQALIGLIRQMMWRTRRYEHAYFGARQNVSSAFGEHRKLLAALRRRDLVGACRLLEANMLSAIPDLVRWLDGAAG